MAVPTLRDYISTAETQAMLVQLTDYCTRTDSAERNICSVATVDTGILRRIRCGALLTEGQYRKFKKLMKQFPDGVTAYDKLRKADQSKSIEERMRENEERRARHVAACRKAERERYGQNFGDWTPVERMIA